MSVEMALSIATTGLHNAESRFTEAATAITNISAVNDSLQSEVKSQQAASSSSSASSSSGTTTATPIQPSPTLQLADSDSDLTGSMVDMLTAKISYSASARVMKAADDMAKTTVDMLG